MSTETKHRIDSRTMTAWQQTHYGGPETLRATEVAVPEAGKGEVLLKIHATALNAGDIRILRGDPGLVRLAFGLTRPRTATRGMDQRAVSLRQLDSLLERRFARALQPAGA